MRPTLWLIPFVLLGTPIGAQQWLPADSVPLVRRAIAARTDRDGDPLLAGWRAEAHGVVRFSSVIGHGGNPVERVIKVDELRVEVYGEAPNRSKQMITAWRDTTFLPNRVSYHRDHLGIVTNDFGAAIRLGDGDEVRDVPHPLSQAGAATYRYAVGDTLRLGTGEAAVRVLAIDVRPENPAVPAAVGTLYLDLDRASLVRFRFTFTAAAYRDPTVEAITVVLETALQERAQWLPWRQAIVIRRATSWLDLPVRTVLRADWTIEEYQVGLGHPPNRFAGPAIGGLRRPAPDSSWTMPIASALDALPPTDADVAAARRDALRAIGDHLSGLPAARASADGVSGVVRVNRVQGVRVAPAFSLAGPGGLTIAIRGGAGTSDRGLVGGLNVTRAMSGTVVGVELSRAVRDVADESVISGTLNSIRTLVAGDDRLDWVQMDRAAVAAHHDFSGLTAKLEVAREHPRSIATAFSSLGGSARMNPALGGPAYTVLRGNVSGQFRERSRWMMAAEGSAGGEGWGRVAGGVEVVSPGGPSTLSIRLRGGAATTFVPPHRSFVLGGRATLPGIPHRSIGGRRFAWGELAWTHSATIPTPPFPFARKVVLPSAVGLFVAAGVAGGGVDGVPWRPSGRLEPVAGLRIDAWGPILRVDVGVGLRRGTVGLTIDIHPDWWPIL
ncbi:MAG: hypothetical protein ABIR59_00485 [Gemmatimonadales bacterium]